MMNVLSGHLFSVSCRRWGARKENCTRFHAFVEITDGAGLAEGVVFEINSETGHFGVVGRVFSALAKMADVRAPKRRPSGDRSGPSSSLIGRPAARYTRATEKWEVRMRETTLESLSAATGSNPDVVSVSLSRVTLFQNETRKWSTLFLRVEGVTVDRFLLTMISFFSSFRYLVPPVLAHRK